MSDPIKYNPGYSFSDYQASNPSDPLPAPQVDTELANISQSVNQTIDALKDVRRSDGKLNNGVVTFDSLALDLALGVKVPVPWEPNIVYAVNDAVIANINPYEGIYLCIAAHTSSASFQADFNAGYWELAFTLPTGDKGWTIEPRLVSDGARSVLQVASFVGGSGAPPSGVGLYIGSTGLVSNIADAIDIRGQQGPQGTRGVQWRGTWSNSATYAVNDIVSDNDSGGLQAVWIATAVNTNTKPKDSPSSWNFFPGSFPGTVDDGLWSDPVTETYDDGTWQ